MDELDLLHILNALFSKTNVYVHSASGNNTSDTWENHDEIFDCNSMTYYAEDSYTDYGGFGPNGTRKRKARFVLEAPNMKYVQALLDISAADGNAELTALLLELTRKLRDGLITYEYDSSDRRQIGEDYDIYDDTEDDWDDDEDLEEEDYAVIRPERIEEQIRREQEEARQKEIARLEEWRKQAEERQRIAVETRKAREEERRRKAEEKQRIADEARKVREEERRKKAEEKQRIADEARKAREEEHRRMKQERLQRETVDRERQVRENVLYRPGEEPTNIRKRIDILLPKLDATYPDKKISGLYNEHKKWGETVTELYRALGYPDGNVTRECIVYFCNL